MGDLTEEQAKVISQAWGPLVGFKKTAVTRWLGKLPHGTIGIFSGNQAGKTASVAYNYVKRLLGIHPIEGKNKLMKKVRCMSSTLPSSAEASEQDNTQYLELKKLIPAELIKRDITARSTAMVVARPCGVDCVFEFRSSKQELQDLGKIQLSSVWHDEETPKMHREECRMRLLAEGGDEIFSLTPTNALCFDTETELITRRGWKRYDEVLMSDEILTYSMERDVVEWKRMNGFTVYEHDGEMLHMHNGSFDFLVTPNHKWVVCNDRRREESYLEEAQNLNTKHIIKRIADTELGGDAGYEDEFIAIVGWLVSDGSFCRSHTSIYQSLTAYPEKCAAIDGLVARYGSEVKTTENDYGPTVIEGKPWDGYGRMKRWMLSGELRRRVRSVTNGKTVNHDFICSLSKRQLQILSDAIVDGDGYRTESGGIRLNQTKNEGLIDDFQLISTLLGRLSRKSRWVNTNYKPIDGVNVYANSERFWPNTHVKSIAIDRVPYKGMVWCPSSENKTVVVRRNGCVSISGNSYTFDEVWQQASLLLRTPSITERYKLPAVEKKKLNPGIACINMATDDNPVLDADDIERIFDTVDPAEIDLRRYGQFKQITGRVHKTYDPRYCYISFEKHFADGIPYNWTHCRGIDYHESRTPWSIGWLACSPDDEWFLWKEFHPAIDGPHAMNTYEISKSVVRRSEDYNFTVNLIDPLAHKKQANSGFSVVDDLNRNFESLRLNEGMGTPSYWEVWDTKGTNGRGEVMRRFKNAVKVGVPFNNGVMHKGRFIRLPTLWVCDTAPNFHKSVMTWRYGEYTTSQTKAVNDPKVTPQQRFSHDCMVLECLAKDYRVLNAAHFFMNPPRQMTGHARSATGR